MALYGDPAGPTRSLAGLLHLTLGRRPLRAGFAATPPSVPVTIVVRNLPPVGLRFAAQLAGIFPTLGEIIG